MTPTTTATRIFTTYLTTLLSLSLLAQSKPLSFSTAPPTSPVSSPRQTTTTGLYTWQATDFTFGCGSAACGVGFNVTAAAGYAGALSSAPAFDVQCGATYGTAAAWTDCTSNTAQGEYETETESQVQVLWDTSNGTAPPYKVRVSHAWFDGAAGAQWNATGEGSSAGAAEFEVRGRRLVGEVTSA